MGAATVDRFLDRLFRDPSAASATSAIIRAIGAASA
jgi:hypothetical protein